MNEALDLQHTRNYIHLFQMQVQGVLLDMEKPSEQLSDQFSESLLNLHEIKDFIADDDKFNKEILLERVQNLISEMFECVSSMQFLDSKRQRIEHVSDGLNLLIEKDSDTDDMKFGWDQINNMIVEQFKMDKERKIYQKYLQESDAEYSCQRLINSDLL